MEGNLEGSEVAPVELLGRSDLPNKIFVAVDYRRQVWTHAAMSADQRMQATISLKAPPRTSMKRKSTHQIRTIRIAIMIEFQPLLLSPMPQDIADFLGYHHISG